MSGALLLSALQRVRTVISVEVVVAPVSKHPFVTLSADTDAELRDACQRYERLSKSFMTTKLGPFGTRQSRRMVLLDSSSAAGSDAQLFFDRVSSWGWSAGERIFVSLIEAVGEEDDYAPGPSREAKTLRPDAAALTAVGFDVIYTSHLRFLARSIEQQDACAGALRAEFPELTGYWDQDAGDRADVANRLARTRAKSTHRTHARTARSTKGVADRLGAALLDVERQLPVSVDDRARTKREALLRN
ncbi:hypothetical protein KXD97_32375 (plasmid) [Mycobacterium sp. SMC-8]|uniref:hypothetical protein n=1 Tax=Mycobacterium sp. SMC-8 TaxID=2857060 RepID=UPI0021B1D100|nr:hypothetical protein [Mycobacterium sp. SMC-8]UXA15839.1 hypothetical protein KXD97_32375 [Mycobacterium sp. SMC-8]